MRPINRIIIHCTATPEGRPHSVADVRKWHIERGFADIGYHYLVKLDGSVEDGRNIEKVGAHVKGHNSDSIGIAYVGGCDKDMKPKDTRTPAQKEALRVLVVHLRLTWPDAEVLGHRDLDNGKACPSFDVRTEL